MSENQTMNVKDFKSELKLFLDETFDSVTGYYLDKQDDLKHTLDGVTAEQASVLSGGCGNSIASQLRHFNFYIEVGLQYMSGNPPESTDWGAAWEQTTVTEQEWSDIQARTWELKDQLYSLIQNYDGPFDEDQIGGAFGMVAHCAFHLGQIRHAKCMAGI